MVPPSPYDDAGYFPTFTDRNLFDHVSILPGEHRRGCVRRHNRFVIVRICSLTDTVCIVRLIIVVSVTIIARLGRIRCFSG